MDWRSLALKNIWRNMRRYLSYLFASTMAVMVFSMFFIFIFNPMVLALSTLQMVAVVMGICVFIVAWFAVFFIFFFHSSLIRTRNKEFGMLLTLGMTPRQVGRLVFLESLCIAALALLLGMALGILGTRPFFLAMGMILGLQDAIPFTLSPFAFIVTTIFFGVVFLVEACLISWRVRRRTPRALILGARVQQTPPRASLLMVGLGLLCLGVAYDMAIQFSQMFLLNGLPIVVLTIIGTFLLFSQVMVMVLSALRRRPLQGLNLLIVSRLIYRLKDYARMLAVVTILNASVLTGMGAVYGILQTFQVSSAQVNPVDILLAENMAHPYPVTSDQIHNALSTHRLTLQGHFDEELLVGQIADVPVSILSRTSFETIRTAILHIHPDYADHIPVATLLGTTQAHLYEPKPAPYLSHLPKTVPFPGNGQLEVHVGSTTLLLHADKSDTRVFNMGIDVPEQLVVVNDQVYAQLQNTPSVDNRWYLHGFYLPNNQQRQTAIRLLQQEIGDVSNTSLRSALNNILVVQLFSALLFTGCFVSALFLFAAGSALYFKLFTQQDEDRRQFAALNRIGLQKREALRIITIEFLLLFFLPVLVAVIHSSVASLDLIFLLRVPVFIAQIIWNSLVVTSLIYAACFAVYFLVALFNYVHRVNYAIA